MIFAIFGLGLAEFLVLGCFCFLPTVGGMVVLAIYLLTRRDRRPPPHPGDERERQDDRIAKRKHDRD